MKKFVLWGIVLILVTVGLNTMSSGEQMPAPRGELRVVDTAPMNWATITWNVFEHLVELDKDGQMVPRLATAWRWLDDRTLEMTLRQGVKFHNGEVFDADIVKLNLEENTRLRQAHRSGDYWNFFNMRKAESPWRDVQLRKAVNMAINRDDLIRYATKGNGVIVPALLAVNAFGYEPTLAPYVFDPAKARALLREAGYPDGLAVTLIAPPPLEIQATVVGKMLEQVGFTVERQILEPAVYNQKTRLSDLNQPAEQQAWDIALTSWNDAVNFPPIHPYAVFALNDAYYDWVLAEPELQRLYAQVARTVDREQQQALIRQMERHTHDQAYFLFLYNPIKLYAVNKTVEFVPYVSTTLNLSETSVMGQHWSVRKQKAETPE